MAGKSFVQETAENAADSAHSQYVHGAQAIPEGDVRHDRHKQHAHFCSLVPNIDENGRFDKTSKLWTKTYVDTINSSPR